MTRTKALVAGLTATALLLAGCSQSEVAEPALTTVDNAQDAEPETVVETVTTAPSEKNNGSEKCASLAHDPREQYPSGSAPGRMPVATGGDTQYWIEDIDNYYDPCAPVSWIIFHGGRGSLDGPAHTGASISDGIAFYINGEPDGEMRTFRRINNVALTGDTIDFTWSERQQDLTGSVKLENNVTLQFDNGRIEPVAGDIEAFNLYWNGLDQYMLGHDG